MESSVPQSWKDLSSVCFLLIDCLLHFNTDRQAYFWSCSVCHSVWHRSRQQNPSCRNVLSLFFSFFWGGFVFSPHDQSFSCLPNLKTSLSFQLDSIYFIAKDSQRLLIKGITQILQCRWTAERCTLNKCCVLCTVPVLLASTSYGNPPSCYIYM